MPRKRKDDIEKWHDRHGKLRHYFRVGKGPRTPLPGVPGSREFQEAYAAALSGELSRTKPPAKGTAVPRSIGALVASYIESPKHQMKKPNTRRGNLARFEALRLAHGHRSVAGMTRENIEKGILKPYSDRPGAYIDTVKKLRILVKHAIDLKWISSDPTVGIQRPKNGEVRAWTEEEIARFEARWPIGTKQRLAMSLMLHTGQRRSDVHRMTWADIDDGRIAVVQQKTGAKLRIRIHKDLAQVLDASRNNHMVILSTAYDRPFTIDGFSGFMRDAIRKAGLPLDAKPHGLRKAAGRRLAEAGCSAHQIMAVLGHSTLAEAERYTRDADQQTLADGAIGRVEGRKRNKPAQTKVVRFGKKAE